MLKQNKKAAIELSMSTIVVLVLSVSLLIMGIIFIRSLMCSGIQITEDLSAGVKNEVKNLFGADKYGVKCIGEGGQDINFGTGGRRKVICILKTQEQTNYDIQISGLKSLKGSPDSAIEKWAISKGWTGSVSPGQDTEAPVLILDIPSDAPTTTIKITFLSKNVNTGSQETITSIIDITPTGAVKGAIC